MKSIKILLFCSILYVSCLGSAEAIGKIKIIQIQEYKKTDICHISNIDDGDTFDLDCKTGYYPDVRLIGVNSPDYDYRKKQGKCYYNEAREYIQAKKKKEAYEVTFYGKDLCKDSFKGCRNLVRMVGVESRMDIGQTMILQGFAFSWTNFSMVPGAMRKLYDNTERLSSENHLGLWNQCKIITNHISGINISRPPRMTR